MSDHLVLYVDPMIRSLASQSESEPVEVHSSVPRADSESTAPSCSVATEVTDDRRVEEDDVLDDEEAPLIQAVECRICQEEDSISNLETPCACSGSLKYAHRKCVQHWCNEKGDTTCEICHQPYQPGYTSPPPPPVVEETIIDIGGRWTISGSPLDIRDPRLLAIAEAERHFLDDEYDDYAGSDASGTSLCRSVALILMALLLLRHALTITDPDGNDDVSAFFSIFLLRAVGFLLPCYIMAWAISILHRRQRQQAAATAATRVAFVLQSGQHRPLQFAIPPEPAVTSVQEHV